MLDLAEKCDLSGLTHLKSFCLYKTDLPEVVGSPCDLLVAISGQWATAFSLPLWTLRRYSAVTTIKAVSRDLLWAFVQ